MIVLDGLRKAVDGVINVPPFHTGHLGLTPGVSVSANLMRPNRTESHCELYVTPFKEPTASMCRLECTMLDKPGVVCRLIEAVSLLGMEIVKMETTVDEYLRFHFVEMVLNWQRTDLTEPNATRPKVLARYADLHCRIPINDTRYVWLFEAIMSFCGDVVLVDKAYATWLPAIRLIPFTPRYFGDQDNLVIEPNKEKCKNFWVRFKLSDDRMAQIRNLTGYKSEEPFHYILRSETNDRTLKVLIPTKRSVPKLLYVSFRHSEDVEARSVITEALREAEFNILTCLVRRMSAKESTLETLLEYRGAGKPPERPAEESPEYCAKVLKWCAKKLRTLPQLSLAKLGRLGTTLESPRFPPTRCTERIPVGTQAELPLSNAASTTGKPILLTRLEEQIKSLTQTGQETEQDSKRMTFLRSVEQNVLSVIPYIFLSYSTKAEKLISDHLSPALKELRHEGRRFEVTHYHEPDNNEILSSVKRRIREADFFIGIWHHEEARGGRHTVSPWMPFEYGIASDEEKTSLIVYSDKLDATEITRRINPGNSSKSYTEMTFATEAVPFIVSICKEWLRGWRVPKHYREVVRWVSDNAEARAHQSVRS